MAFSKSPRAADIVSEPTLPGGTPTEKAGEPDLGHDLIPASRYTSPEFMAREWEQMWSRSWLLHCRESELAKSGQAHTLDIGPESVVVIRSQDGVLRAFHNACQHRGTRIFQEGPSHVRQIVCPFHKWAWHLDGTLADVTDSDTFPQGIDTSRLGLSPVRCETWGGFVFVNLNPDAEPLSEFLGIVVEHLGPYHFEGYYLAEETRVEWNCNWKTSVDAFNESYHAMAIHPQILGYLDDFRIQIDLYDRHSRFLVPQAIASPRLPQDAPDPIVAEMGKMYGMSGADLDLPVLEFRKALQKAKRRWAGEKGYDFSELNDDQLTDDYHYTIFPNMTLNILAEEMWLFRQLPHPKDPDRMFFDFQIYRALPTGESAPAPQERRCGKGADFDLNNEVLNQDAANLPNVQRGMHSAGFDGLYLSSQERRIRHFHKTLMDYLNG